MRRSGQALVEFALVAPLLFALLYGILWVGVLELSALRAQNGIDVLADLAAAGPGWQSEVKAQDERTGCNASPHTPDSTETEGPNGTTIVSLVWNCHPALPPVPFIDVGAVAIEVEASAVMPGEEVSPSASPSQEPSPSPSE